MASCAICGKETEGSKYALIRSHGVEADERRFLCMAHTDAEVLAVLPDTPTDFAFNSPVTNRLMLNGMARSVAVQAYAVVREAQPQIAEALERVRRSLPKTGDIVLRPDAVGMGTELPNPARG